MAKRTGMQCPVSKNLYRATNRRNRERARSNDGTFQNIIEVSRLARCLKCRLQKVVRRPRLTRPMRVKRRRGSSFSAVAEQRLDRLISINSFEESMQFPFPPTAPLFSLFPAAKGSEVVGLRPLSFTALSTYAPTTTPPSTLPNGLPRRMRTPKLCFLPP